MSISQPKDHGQLPACEGIVLPYSTHSTGTRSTWSACTGDAFFMWLVVPAGRVKVDTPASQPFAQLPRSSRSGRGDPGLSQQAGGGGGAGQRACYDDKADREGRRRHSLGALTTGWTHAAFRTKCQGFVMSVICWETSARRELAWQ